jgi:hypothetical protein
MRRMIIKSKVVVEVVAVAATGGGREELEVRALGTSRK